jgi:hypothetical protein
MRALVLGVATLALSAGAALAQGACPNGSAETVYPNSGYAPFGYGYVPSAPIYNYAAPPYDYGAPAYGPEQSSVPTRTARHHTISNSSHKGDFLKTAPANGGY